MQRDALAYADADGAELGAVRPYAVAARIAAGNDAERAAISIMICSSVQTNSATPKPAWRERDDRIEDELTGAVERGATAAVDGDVRDAPRRKRSVDDIEVRSGAALAEGDRRRVLDGETDVRAALAPCSPAGVLPRESSIVSAPSEPLPEDRRAHFRDLPRA